MAREVVTTFKCSRCGARLRDGLYVYSRFTKARYCRELAACTKRTKRKR